MLSLCFALVAATTAFAQDVASEPKFEVKDGKLVVTAPITFETGKATLTSESAVALAHVKAYLDDKTYITTLRVENHSDSMGSEAFSQKLSESRALAVAKALVARGVDCKRLIAAGFGSTKPATSNDTAENRAKNRRTEFANAALRGRPIGGMPVDGGGVVAGDVCAK